VTDVLADVRLQREPAGDDAAAPTTVEGGILVDADGWYRWQLDPPCPDATLSFNGEAIAADAARPMLAGVHPFTLSLPQGSACKLPLRVMVESLVPQRKAPVPPESYVSRQVSTLPEVRAREVESFGGYGTPQLVMQFKGRPVDFGVDAQGHYSVLMRDGDGYHIRRYDEHGKELAAWPVEVPLTINPATIAVAADGTTAVLVQNIVQMYDPQGKRIANWVHPWFVWETQLAFWGDLLVANIHHRDSFAILKRSGDLVTEFKTFEGGPGKLYAPMAFALGAEGDLLVEQADGQALRFHLDGPEFKPVFVESFRVDAASPGTGFDGPERILVANERGLRVFGRGGKRLMANEPKRDPSQQEFSGAVHVRRIGDRLLILDSERNALWTISG